MKKTAVLFIHGFLGSPLQFQLFLPALEAAGADAVLLTLPGHGGSLSDFCETGKVQWQACVQQHINALSAEYDALYLVGHSMGGLLAIDAAMQMPQKIKGILALCLPLYVRITPRTLRILPKSVMKGETRDPYVLAARQFSGVGGITVWNSPQLIKNTLALLRMMGETRRMLPSLSVPLRVINSEKDELLSKRSVAFVKKQLPAARTELLQRSGHFYFAPEEIPQLLQAAISLLREGKEG